MSLWRSLSNESGFVFARANPSRDARWDWIIETISHEFECDADDVSLVEDDDGRELITVGGEIVAEIHNGYVQEGKPLRSANAFGRAA